MEDRESMLGVIQYVREKYNWEVEVDGWNVAGVVNRKGGFLCGWEERDGGIRPSLEDSGDPHTHAERVCALIRELSLSVWGN